MRINRFLAVGLASLTLLVSPLGAQTSMKSKSDSVLTKLRLIAADSTIVVGHRGDSGVYPENTAPSFQSAVDAGAEMVELDFYQTEDDVLVCHHDKTLDRTTDSVQRWKKKGLHPADFKMSELAKLDAGSWKGELFAGVGLPTLEAALAIIQKGSITMIEHKRGDPELLVKLLRKMNLVDDVLVQSFNWEWLEKVHELEPRLTLAALGGTKRKPHPTAKLMKQIAQTGATMVHWSFKRIRPEDVKMLHRKGYLVCVYTVNSVGSYQKAIAMGIDAITTNHPGLLVKHLASTKVGGASKRD